MRLAHTADIHWRGLNRHDEYREVFSSFIEDCRKNEVDHIFIGGDIFHTKTSGISPEYIEQLTWWLVSMSEVAEVHLILGNHDGNLVNLSRQDAVSPIVSALNNPRVHLYKNSGVYEFAPGYNWCVFSPFDEENWEKVEPEKGKFNIACYHGQVRGSVTETGWDITEGITTEFFKNYDLALLGDIHKFQILGYKNDKPWIAYPGTPVQQNYAEQIEHGYLLWDISSYEDWSLRFRKLPNPRPFVTLEWNGSQKNLISESAKYPQQTRFRVKSSVPVSQGDVQAISDLLRSERSASEVTFKLDVKAETSVIKAGSSVVEKSNIRSQETILSLLQSYYKENKHADVNWNLTEIDVKKYLTDVMLNDDVARGAKWSLRHLKWDNMFAYGEENEIDFSKLNGIVGIFGSNRIGKSSIVGTIMYSLFNTTDRGSMKNLYVCNIRKNYCSSRAIFDHDGKTHIIERQTSKTYNKKGGLIAGTHLNLFRMNDDGEADDLCGEQRTDTEKIIKSLIGTSEDFLMTSFSAQGEIGAFIQLSSSKRRAMLSKFLDLDIFDKMHELANKDLLGFKARLKTMPEKNWEDLHTRGNEMCAELRTKIEDLDDRIVESQTDLSEFRAQLSSYKEFKPVTASEVESHRRRVSTIETTSRECSEKISILNEEIKSLSEKLNAVEHLLDSHDLNELRQQLSMIETLERSISSLRHVHDKELSTFLQQQKSLRILKEVPCGDSFPTCKFIKDAHIDRSNIPDQEMREIEAKNSLAEAERALASADKPSIIQRISRQEKASSLAASLKLEISRKETEIEKNKASCETHQENLRTAKIKLKDLEDSLKNEENYEVVNLRTKIEELSRSIKGWDSEKLSLATQHGKMLSDLEKLKSEKLQRDELINDMKSLEMMCEAFSRKGLPLSITKSQLPIINEEISKILSGIVDFTIELENDEETDSTEIYINYGDSRRIIELCSGMEKTIGSIAIRVALVNVTSLPKSDMFIIDEGFGTLDEAGVEACNRLLVSLKKYFRVVLVITHVDGIKDMADHIIEITKNEKDSRVTFT